MTRICLEMVLNAAATLGLVMFWLLLEWMIISQEPRICSNTEAMSQSQSVSADFCGAPPLNLRKWVMNSWLDKTWGYAEVVVMRKTDESGKLSYLVSWVHSNKIYILQWNQQKNVWGEEIETTSALCHGSCILEHSDSKKTLWVILDKPQWMPLG